MPNQVTKYYGDNMNRILRIVGKVILSLLVGLFLVCLAGVIYWCSTDKLAYLINESATTGTTIAQMKRFGTVGGIEVITPRFVAEFFLFNFRGGKKDIAEFKMNDGGLNYIVSALSNSKLSKEKKAKYIKYFISKGCGVNDFSGIDGLTPLHGAALSGDADTTELLLANGADPLLKSKGPEVFNNMTPLEVVERANKKFPKKEYVKIIEILREAESKNRQK
jgi:hypothetical protein